MNKRCIDDVILSANMFIIRHFFNKYFSCVKIVYVYVYIYIYIYIYNKSQLLGLL